MNRYNPEIDPFAVALIASQLLSHCKYDQSEAVLQAQNLLRLSRNAIAHDERERSMMEKMYEGHGISCPDTSPMPEKNFLGQMCDGLTKETRIDRLQKFLRRWWPDVRNKYLDAPDITNRATWTEETVDYWHDRLVAVVKSARAATNKTNAENLKQVEKSSKVDLDS
jgi:hypothetical protein